MTKYIDLEKEGDAALTDFDIIIVGAGAAGLTMVRELGGKGLKIAVVESGSLEETPLHEELNRVEVSPALMDDKFIERRRRQHGDQLKVWDPTVQRFGVRCRVLGGSTAGWAGKVAAFDRIDYEKRPWIDSDEWPVTPEAMNPYLERAAQHLDLGPMAQGDEFWQYGSRQVPEEISKLQHFKPFFWQFARSRNALTDVMRFGPDFLEESFDDVTIFLNATATSIKSRDGTVSGIEAISSLQAKHRTLVNAKTVVLACGAIENARLLLLSQDASSWNKNNDAIGRYLMDHPSVRLGEFSGSEKNRAAKLFGFYPILQNYRVYMYSCGLALSPETQRKSHMPNMAVFLGMTIADNDPLHALARLAKLKSTRPFADSFTIVKNLGFVVTSLGQKLLNYRRIPIRLRRLIVDAVVFMNANLVARDYTGHGRGRQLDSVTLNIISEQPPDAGNRIVLSENVDYLGLRLAKIEWEISPSLKLDMVRFARFLRDDLARVGIKGFKFDDAFETEDGSALTFCDMAHTAGTTRMGSDPATSVVDPSLQVHGMEGLFAVGASVFPSSGHANPTLVILALAVRLADEIKNRVDNLRLNAGRSHMVGIRPIVVVTAAEGSLGSVLIERLIARGYRVRGQFRDKRPTNVNVEWVQCDFSKMDISDDVFDKLLDGASAVLYLTTSHSTVGELQIGNVVNLERLAEASERKGIRYFGLESSMVVYGSPTTRLVGEDALRINLKRPIKKQYFAEPFMREYARSKVMGEDVISNYATKLHVDIYRVAVEQDSAGVQDCLKWNRKRALFSVYRNSHFISSKNVALAMVHLMERSLESASLGVDVYNIADTASPTFAAIYRKAGRKVGLNVPIVFDLLKGVKVSKTISFRYPMGCFRLDDRKLRGSGFNFDQDR